MSRLIIRSQAELLYTNNRYSTLYMYHDTATKKTPGKNRYNLIKLFIVKHLPVVDSKALNSTLFLA